LKFNSLQLNKKDNVAVALIKMKKGDISRFDVDGKFKEIKIKNDVQCYHKFAIANIKKGSNVYKYGEVIGIATDDINPGTHVHSHNLLSIRQKLK